MKDPIKDQTNGTKLMIALTIILVLGLPLVNSLDNIKVLVIYSIGVSLFAGRTYMVLWTTKPIMGILYCPYCKLHFLHRTYIDSLLSRAEEMDTVSKIVERELAKHIKKAHPHAKEAHLKLTKYGRR